MMKRWLYVYAALCSCVAEAESSICTGIGFTCAILEDSRLKCWGSGLYGTLGSGSSENTGFRPSDMGEDLKAVDLGAGMSVSKISCGWYHACALLGDGGVKCWGRGLDGVLGQGDEENRGDEPGEMGDNLVAIDLGPIPVVDISSGLDFNCALFANGEVKCWGKNRYGVLGKGSSEAVGGRPGQMGSALKRVDLGSNRTALQVSCGNSHACALLDNGEVKCWGGDGSGSTFGTLGFQATHVGWRKRDMGNALPAVNLSSNVTAVYLSASLHNTCALLDSRQLKCWGWDIFGSLGRGDEADIGYFPSGMGDALLPVDLGQNRSVVHVANGAGTVCAVLDDGSVKCWGRNGGLGAASNLGNLGDEQGEMGDNLVPVDLGAGSISVQVSCGVQFSCALLNSGEVKCWGKGNNGQLGQGTLKSHGDGGNGKMGDALKAIDLGGRVRVPPPVFPPEPTLQPSLSPTLSPSLNLSLSPTSAPTSDLSPSPTLTPSDSPTVAPSRSPEVHKSKTSAEPNQLGIVLGSVGGVCAGLLAFFVVVFQRFVKPKPSSPADIVAFS